MVTLVLLLGGAAIAVAHRVEPTGAEDAPYRWWWRTLPSGDTELVVTPVGGDWAAYRAANRDRIDRWLAHPDSAPELSGAHLLVSFAAPITPTLLAHVLEPLAGTVVQCTAIGQDEDGWWVEETALGAPRSDAIGVTRTDVAADYTYTLEGVVACSVVAGTRGTLAPDDLDAVRQSRHVYLLDTTAMQVVRLERGATDEGPDAVVVQAPWHLAIRSIHEATTHATPTHEQGEKP